MRMPGGVLVGVAVLVPMLVVVIMVVVMVMRRPVVVVRFVRVANSSSALARKFEALNFT